MILKRRVISISVILSIVCLIAFFSNYENRNAEISVGVKQKPQIIIDAGHGGFDGGAVADDGTVEKDINLNISNTLSELLRIYGFEVIVTRSIDASTDNTESKKIATCITNGFWATSKKVAREKLEKLVCVGLRYLTLSYDDFHREFIPVQNIRNIIEASYQLPIRISMNMKENTISVYRIKCITIT